MLSEKYSASLLVNEWMCLFNFVHQTTKTTNNKTHLIPMSFFKKLVNDTVQCTSITKINKYINMYLLNACIELKLSSFLPFILIYKLVWHLAATWRMQAQRSPIMINHCVRLPPSGQLYMTTFKTWTKLSVCPRMKMNESCWIWFLCVFDLFIFVWWSIFMTSVTL